MLSLILKIHENLGRNPSISLKSTHTNNKYFDTIHLYRQQHHNVYCCVSKASLLLLLGKVWCQYEVSTSRKHYSRGFNEAVHIPGIFNGDNRFPNKHLFELPPKHVPVEFRKKCKRFLGREDSQGKLLLIINVNC